MLPGVLQILRAFLGINAYPAARQSKDSSMITVCAELESNTPTDDT